jgi:hypothetical protein
MERAVTGHLGDYAWHNVFDGAVLPATCIACKIGSTDRRSCG